MPVREQASDQLAYAIRGMLGRPAFSLVVIATIALGVGANTAMFSVVYGVLLRPLPYTQVDRLVVVRHKAPALRVSDAEFLDYQREVKSFASLGAYTVGEVTLTGGNDAERVAIANVTRNFLETMGRLPQLGRTFGDEDDRARLATVAIISHRLWQRQSAADMAVLGKTIEVNGFKRTVIGVMPAHFDYPMEQTDVWLPMMRLNPDSVESTRANHYLSVVGRLQPGVSVRQAAAEMNVAAARIMQERAASYNPNEPLTPEVASLAETLLGPTRQYLWLLLGAVGVVLLIVCLNVANLLLSRGEGRRKEMAVRAALGASRTRLASQLVTESMVFALIGGALGLALAAAGTRGLLSIAPGSIPRLDEVGLDWIVVAYALAISIAAGLLFGLSPAIRATQQSPSIMLKSGGTTAHHGSSRRVRKALVVVEVALAVAILSGAGLLFRSLVNLQNAPLGFRPDGVLTAKVSLSGRYNEPRAAVFFDQLLAKVRAIPGVQAAAAAAWLPVVDAGGSWAVLPEGGVPRNRDWPTVVPQQVTTDYFRTTGMHFIAGQDFTGEERADAPLAAVLSEAAVKSIWPEDADARSAVGKRLRVGGKPEGTYMTVVGVVNDFRSRGYDVSPEPTMYLPLPQSHLSGYFLPRSMSLVVRSAGNPVQLAPQLRGIVRELDPTVPVSRVRTLDDLVGSSVANRRFTTALLIGFAVLALLLAGLGIFGVISYGVSERTSEIGMRVALGAQRGQVLKLILLEGLQLAFLGALIGVAGAAAQGEALRSMLVGVRPIDVPVLLGIVGLLLIVAVAASFFPARRAMSVNPTEALRT